MSDHPNLPKLESIQQQVRIALAEDIGSGDVSAQLIPVDKVFSTRIICREDAVLCGTAWVNEVFQQLDSNVVIDWLVDDGERLKPDQTLCEFQGSARSILTGERTALNFLQLLSGTATLARHYADAVAGINVRLLDTRKTVPGLRLAQKYAVLCGGCDNHRTGLFDAVMLKENHIAAGDSITSQVRRAREQFPGIPIIVEVETLQQLDEAANTKADRALLDNFDLHSLRQAVNQYADAIRLEASGGITLATVRQVAETGVHDISIGEICKRVDAIDFSMRYHTVDS